MQQFFYVHRGENTLSQSIGDHIIEVLLIYGLGCKAVTAELVLLDRFAVLVGLAVLYLAFEGSAAFAAKNLAIHGIEVLAVVVSDLALVVSQTLLHLVKQFLTDNRRDTADHMVALTLVLQLVAVSHTTEVLAGTLVPEVIAAVLFILQNTLDRGLAEGLAFGCLVAVSIEPFDDLVVAKPGGILLKDRLNCRFLCQINMKLLIRTNDVAVGRCASVVEHFLGVDL